MKGQTHEEPKILAAAERQMRASALQNEIDDRSPPPPHRKGGKVQPYVTISRESGVDGGEIAERLGSELGWEVLDRNLLDEMAHRFHMSRPKLEEVDETSTDWVYDNLGTCFDKEVVPHERYMACLRRIVEKATQRSSCVLVGRGVQFLLPPELGVRVRILAPVKYRVERMMQREGVDRNEAWDLMRKVDAGRRSLVHRYFDYDIDDPHLYDLVLNIEYQSKTSLVQQIALAVKQKHLVQLRQVAES